MPRRFEKIIRKLDPKLRRKVNQTVRAILENQLSGLDIKPLRGFKGRYRCRIGKIRIIFSRVNRNRNEIKDVEFRGSAYKN